MRTSWVVVLGAVGLLGACFSRDLCDFPVECLRTDASCSDPGPLVSACGVCPTGTVRFATVCSAADAGGTGGTGGTGGAGGTGGSCSSSTGNLSELRVCGAAPAGCPHPSGAWQLSFDGGTCLGTALSLVFDADGGCNSTWSSSACELIGGGGYSNSFQMGTNSLGQPVCGSTTYNLSVVLRFEDAGTASGEATSSCMGECGCQLVSQVSAAP